MHRCKKCHFKVHTSSSSRYSYHCPLGIIVPWLTCQHLSSGRQEHDSLANNIDTWVLALFSSDLRGKATAETARSLYYHYKLLQRPEKMQPRSCCTPNCSRWNSAWTFPLCPFVQRMSTGRAAWTLKTCGGWSASSVFCSFQELIRKVISIIISTWGICLYVLLGNLVGGFYLWPLYVNVSKSTLCSHLMKLFSLQLYYSNRRHRSE